MGFLDKAKKIAEQAQTKIDEVQKQMNQPGTAGSSSGPPIQYDQHGRPVPPEKTASPPHGDPLAGAPASTPPPAPSGPAPDPGAPGGSSAPPPPPSPGATTPGVPPTEPRSGPPAPVEGQAKPPAMPGAPAAQEDDRNHPSTRRRS